MMNVRPAIRAQRFAKLDSGDLFVFDFGHSRCLGLVAEDPTNNGEKLVLPLGPDLPPDMKWPRLQKPSGFTAVSFGRNYSLRLPVSPSCWTVEAPPPETRAILLADDKCYFRANFNMWDDRFQPCYVDVAMGIIFAIGSGVHQEFAVPKGILAYAIAWDIVTTEEEPRIIVRYSGIVAAAQKFQNQ